MIDLDDLAVFSNHDLHRDRAGSGPHSPHEPRCHPRTLSPTHPLVTKPARLTAKTPSHDAANQHTAAQRHESDIPWFSPSSCGGLVMCPGGGLVVVGAGLEAAVQDADQSVPELAQRGVVTDPAGTQGVVVGAGTG